MTVIALKKKVCMDRINVQDTVEENSILGPAGAITPVKNSNLVRV